MSASAKTSVHGPLAPRALLNCSGAPYRGVNAVGPALVAASASVKVG